jgi:CspA family cold shock protein
VTGTVRAWHTDEGWGVIDSPATPGGCWAHFSVIDTDGYRAMGDGDAVRFDFERADQDGYWFRAVRVWPLEKP